MKKIIFVLFIVLSMTSCAYVPKDNNERLFMDSLVNVPGEDAKYINSALEDSTVSNWAYYFPKIDKTHIYFLGKMEKSLGSLIRKNSVLIVADDKQVMAYSCTLMQLNNGDWVKIGMRKLNLNSDINHKIVSHHLEAKKQYIESIEPKVVVNEGKQDTTKNKSKSKNPKPKKSASLKNAKKAESNSKDVVAQNAPDKLSTENNSEASESKVSPEISTDDNVRKQFKVINEEWDF